MQTCTPEGSQEEEVVVVVSMVTTVDTVGDAEPGVNPVVSAWPNNIAFPSHTVCLPHHIPIPTHTTYFITGLCHHRWLAINND